MDKLEILTSENDAYLKNLLFNYYKDGEDADTPDDIVNDFIKYIVKLIYSNKLNCRILNHEGTYIGFIIWFKDEVGHEFSELPGYWSIAEIGIKKEYRNKHFGIKLVNYVEKNVKGNDAASFYITAYSPFKNFWEKIGFKDIGLKGNNNLPIMVKELK